MSEAAPETNAPETDTPPPATGQQPEVDPNAEVEKWKALSRKNEAKAKENAAAAKRLAEIEEATKTEAQKTTDRITALEQQLEAERSSAMRSRVQAKFGISDEDADLFLTGTDEDSLTKQAERLAQVAEDRKKQGNRAPLQGRTPSNPPSEADDRKFAASLFGGD